MYRKYMTEAQARKLKQAQLNAVHTGIRVEQFFPQVEKIEIHHMRTHTSFVGRSEQEGTWVVSPQSEVCFVLSCLNRECTSIGFNLGSVISSAIHSHKTEVTGEMACEGQEAPDHPEQSCDGHLKYSIKISYRHTL